MVLLLVGAFYFQHIEDAQEEAKVKIYKFEKNELENFLKGSLKVSGLIEKFELLEKEVGSTPFLFEVLMSTAFELRSKGYNTEALVIYEKGKNLRLDKYSKHLLHIALAVAYEENTKFAKAQEQLKQLETKSFLSKSNNWLSKLWLDKGRLNLAKGNHADAIKDFTHLIESFPNAPYAKLAEVYLFELNKK